MFLEDAVDLNPAFPLGLDIILGIEDAHDIVRKREVFARDEIMPKKTLLAVSSSVEVTRQGASVKKLWQ